MHARTYEFQLLLDTSDCYLTFSNSIIGSMLSMGWIPEFSSWLNPFCDDVSSTYAIFLLIVCLIQSECFGGTLKPHKRRRRLHITQLPSKLLSQKTDRKREPISSRHILLQISYMFMAKRAGVWEWMPNLKLVSLKVICFSDSSGRKNNLLPSGTF